MKLPGLALCAFLLTNLSHAQQPAFSTLSELNDTLVLRQAQSFSKASSYRQQNPILPEYTTDGTHILLVDIDKFGLPVYRITLNAGAAKTTGADLLQTPALTGFNLSGTNMVIGVWDGGAVKDHIEFGDRLVSTEGESYSDHATHVTGTIIAQGLNPDARGMAPNAKASTHYFNNDLVVMSGLATTGQNSLLISNHSYGTGTGWVRNGNGWNWTGNPAISSVEDYRFGLYTARSMMLDQVAYLAPYYSIFWAAGNDRSDTGDGSRPADCNAGTGYDCIIPDAVAKNVITVGAVNKVPAYLAPSSVIMGNYSSWGPTDDGRIKPDLVAAGTDLFSLSAKGTNTYEVMGGTSMATPSASGSLALVQQLYRDLHGGNYMKAATLKALAIHTTKEAGPFPGPDYSFGWGLLDVTSAAQLVMGENNVDKRIQELTLATGSRIEIPVQPIAGRKLTVTIVWTDPPSLPVAEALDPTTPTLVNDLDLRVVDDSNVEIKPWILDPLNPVRQAFRGDNFRDNVEKIELNSPENRPYRIVVSHKGALKYNKQDFSIVISYQSAAAPATYYWIGNSGSWSNGAHWSASTGGPAANKVPTASDRVIFDENSFTVPNGQLLLTADASCSSFTWNNSTTASINLASNALEISSEIRINSENSVVTGGTVRLKSTTAGKASVQLSNSENATFEISGGTWDWYGTSRIGSVTIKSKLSLHEANLSVLDFTYIPGSAILELNASTLEVRAKAAIPAGLTLKGADSEIVISSTSPDNLIEGMNFSGTLNIAGAATVGGKSTIGTLVVNGHCTLVTPNKFKLIELKTGSEITLKEMQYLDSLAIESSDAVRTKLNASTKQYLYFEKNAKYCFDYLDINSVGILFGSVNAGVNSTLVNAENWQSVPCSEMAYADFTWSYACSKSLIEFRDLSTGSPEKWSWSMTGGAVVVKRVSNTERLDDQNPFYSFSEPGVHPVQLSIIKSNVTVAQTLKNVTILKNHLEPNAVIPDSRVLLSKNSGKKYQWLRDGEPLTGAVSRSFQYNGVPGSYQVAAYGEVCNSLSDPFIVTGFDENGIADIIVSPNPARDEILITGVSQTAHVSIVNAVGAETDLISSGSNVYSVKSFSSGLYIIRISDNTRSTSHKLVVHH
jgi:Subtilase family/Secretion system C-terminal sorting domain